MNAAILALVLSVAPADQPRAVLIFGAPWCGPCQQMRPAREELHAYYDVRYASIDQYRELADYYGVRSVPCVMVVPVGTAYAEPALYRVDGLQTRETLFDIANRWGVGRWPDK